MSIVMTKDLAQRIEQSELQALESRLLAIKEIKGNPMDIEIKKFGNATAFSAKNIPGPSFNTIKGISVKEIEFIDCILDFYHKREVPARFEITPAHSSTDLFKSLSKKGYSQCGFHTVLCGSPSYDFISNKKMDTSISIRELKEHEFDIFGDLYIKGFNMPSFIKDHIAQNNKVLHRDKHWTFYLASYQGESAGIGTLAASATIPKLRNKGIHSALILKRLHEVKRRHCHLIVGQASYGSISQKNMERAGMKIAYTKAIWTKF